MKNLIVCFMMLFVTSLWASVLVQPDWVIFLGEDGHYEVIDDGCPGAVDLIIEETSAVITFGTKC